MKKERKEERNLERKREIEIKKERNFLHRMKQLNSKLV
jgi:hypothetical protein